MKYFISVSAKYPVIATTSELLSTGSDCKMAKLLVLDRNIGSMTLFKQIVGRGTRIRWEDGKTSFTIMDFRDVTRLFADPAWDGPIEQDPGFAGGKGEDALPTKGVAEGNENGNYGEPGGGTDGGGKEPRAIPFVREDGCKVFATTKTVSIYDTDGKLLKQESILDYTRENVQGQYGTLDKFIHTWSAEEKKKAIAEALARQGIDLDRLKRDMGMGDVDDYDFICHVAYDQKPLTRRERAENVKKRDFLHRFSGAAKEVLELLLNQYMNLGIKAIEETSIFAMEDFRKYGKPSRIIKNCFGGKQEYRDALRALENEIYKTKAG